MAGKARAQFEVDEAAEAVATLDELRRRWPDYHSADAHLNYARALEACGRNDGGAHRIPGRLSDYFAAPRRGCATACCWRESGREG
jgi:hypothetical protein